MRFSSKRPRQKSVARRPPKRARRSRTRFMARSVTRSNISCIATPCGRWRGATISAMRATGRWSSASASPRAAPTNYGRWSPRASIQGYSRAQESRSKMTAALRFDPIRLPPECEKLRKQVRAFLADEIAAGTFDPHKPNREDTDPAGKFRRVGVFAVGLVRTEGAGGDLVGEEGAHLLAQHLAFRGQADRIETKGCGHFESRLK